MLDSDFKVLEREETIKVITQITTTDHGPVAIWAMIINEQNNQQNQTDRRNNKQSE